MSLGGSMPNTRRLICQCKLRSLQTTKFAEWRNTPVVLDEEAVAMSKPWGSGWHREGYWSDFGYTLFLLLVCHCTGPKRNKFEQGNEDKIRVLVYKYLRPLRTNRRSEYDVINHVMCFSHYFIMRSARAPPLSSDPGSASVTSNCPRHVLFAMQLIYDFLHQWSVIGKHRRINAAWLNDRPLRK
jgi:hypothetical protein